jgi:hypothetical protein
MASSLRRNPFNRIPLSIITAHLPFTFAIMLCVITCNATAQNDTTPVVKNTIKANRIKTYTNIINNSITKNLNLPLTDSTEENWEDAFYAMELINYKQPWVLQKVKIAFDGIEKRSEDFQRALLELCYTNYPTAYKEEVYTVIAKTFKAKIFAMAAEYLVQLDKEQALPLLMTGYMRFPVIKALDSTESAKAILEVLESQVFGKVDKKFNNKIKELFKKDYLPSNTIVYSIQRKDRNFPGLVIVRGKDGNFITDETGTIFSVPQLARSITNLPGYLTNGNTPQGIFRMNGFDISKSNAIGPTENIQLVMPFETSVRYFLKDSSVTDTAWTPELYERLLPKTLQKYQPLFQTYYASAIGRTEIIAHGTTVDLEYYKGQTYYPYTPTQGCLCTKEIWSDKDGKRIISDQQKLVAAVKKAGGANGYLIVIEIDDQQKPVSINEILPYLKTKNK